MLKKYIANTTHLDLFDDDAHPHDAEPAELADGEPEHDLDIAPVELAEYLHPPPAPVDLSDITDVPTINRPQYAFRTSLSSSRVLWKLVGKPPTQHPRQNFYLDKHTRKPPHGTASRTGTQKMCCSILSSFYKGLII